MGSAYTVYDLFYNNCYNTDKVQKTFFVGLPLSFNEAINFLKQLWYYQ
jgi:hypothetical protein